MIPGVSFFLLGYSGWGLRSSLQQETASPRSDLSPRARIPIWRRDHFLKVNPMLWLALWGRTGRRIVFPLCVLAVSFGIFCRIALEARWNWLVPFVIFGSYGLHALYKFALVAETSRRLSEDRRSGALELLLSTPLPVPFLLRGQMQATLRTWSPFLFSIALMNLIWMTEEEFIEDIGLFLPVSLFLLWPDTRALIWLSLKNSLRPWRYPRVVFQTFLRVMLAPILVLVLTFMAAQGSGMSKDEVLTILFFWAVACTVYDLFIIRDSMRTLRHFRSLAAGEAVAGLTKVANSPSVVSPHATLRPGPASS